MLNGEKSFTKEGSIWAPPLRMVSEWVQAEWQQLDPAIIAKDVNSQCTGYNRGRFSLVLTSQIGLRLTSMRLNPAPAQLRKD